jgi:hypothetical protein
MSRPAQCWGVACWRRRGRHRHAQDTVSLCAKQLDSAALVARIADHAHAPLSSPPASLLSCLVSPSLPAACWLSGWRMTRRSRPSRRRRRNCRQKHYGAHHARLQARALLAASPHRAALLLVEHTRRARRRKRGWLSRVPHGGSSSAPGSANPPFAFPARANPLTHLRCCAVFPLRARRAARFTAGLATIPLPVRARACAYSAENPNKHCAACARADLAEISCATPPVHTGSTSATSAQGAATSAAGASRHVCCTQSRCCQGGA